MNYLFFDIECANNRDKLSKIFSFGYILVNDRFECIKEEEILINPASIFEEHIRENILKVKEETLMEKPKFNEVFPYIKDILCKENQLVFGFAVHNDADFILDECRRYELSCPNLVFYDVALMAKKAMNMKQELSLEKYINLFGLAKNANFHESLADAKYTMLILKELSKKKRINDLIKDNPYCAVKIDKGMIQRKKQRIIKNKSFKCSLIERYPEFFREYHKTK